MILCFLFIQVDLNCSLCYLCCLFWFDLSPSSPYIMGTLRTTSDIVSTVLLINVHHHPIHYSSIFYILSIIIGVRVTTVGIIIIAAIIVSVTTIIDDLIICVSVLMIRLNLMTISHHHHHYHMPITNVFVDFFVEYNAV